jgi:hypothetical protein
VTGTALKKPVNTRNVQATTMSNGDTDELTARIDRLEHELAKLMSERETALTGWPNEPTIAQGFMAGRWQRRDGDSYTQGLANIPEAPYDTNYYGRYQYTWQPVVEEAPALTARRSVTGWARASAGSAVTWISMDDVLVNYVPEVPIGAAAYARVRDGDGGVGWSNVNALGYLSTSGGQMTGPLIARDGGSATNPGLAIGENSTGFYRSGGGQGLLVTTVSGQIVMQLQPVIAAFFIQVDMGSQRISNLGDATADADALNRRTADARYMAAGAGGFLPLSGGNMTGDINLIGTTGPTVPAKLNLYVRGANIAWSEADNTIVFTKGTGDYPLITRANNGGNPQPILDQATGDARYPTLLNGGIIQGPVQLLSTPVTINDAVTKGYVDQSLMAARTPAVIFDLPADVPVAGDGAWHELARVVFPLTRTGLSRIQVTLNCNMSGVNNVASVGARLAAGAAERRMFAFGVTPGGESCGFTCNLYFDTAPGVINIPIEVASLVLTGAPMPFTIIGGSVPERSQIVIVDLGPVG